MTELKTMLEGVLRQADDIFPKRNLKVTPCLRLVPAHECVLRCVDFVDLARDTVCVHGVSINSFLRVRAGIERSINSVEDPNLWPLVSRLAVRLVNEASLQANVKEKLNLYYHFTSAGRAEEISEDREIRAGGMHYWDLLYRCWKSPQLIPRNIRSIITLHNIESIGIFATCWATPENPKAPVDPEKKHMYYEIVEVNGARIFRKTKRSLLLLGGKEVIAKMSCLNFDVYDQYVVLGPYKTIGNIDKDDVFAKLSAFFLYGANLIVRRVHRLHLRMYVHIECEFNDGLNSLSRDELLEIVSLEDMDPDRLLSCLAKGFPVTLDSIKVLRTRMTVYEHTKTVLLRFEKYYSKTLSCRRRSLFRMMFGLHDLGQPKAIRDGANPHVTSSILSSRILALIGFDRTEIKMVERMIMGNLIGSYLEQDDNSNAIVWLSDMKIELDSDAREYLDLCCMYFKCDAGSYPGLSFIFDEDGISFTRSTQKRIDRLYKLLDSLCT